MFFSQFYKSRDKKYKNWTSETVFGYILRFIFYGTCRAKTDFAQ